MIQTFKTFKMFSFIETEYILIYNKHPYELCRIETNVTIHIYFLFIYFETQSCKQSAL